MTGAILWYATRGAGAVSFILLSSVVTLDSDGAAGLMRTALQAFVDEFSLHQRGGCRHGAPLRKAA
jgi:hypothetical protein